MTLEERAIEAAGLTSVVARRSQGETLSASELALAAGCDLLALGAAADRVRAVDVGSEVRVHASTPAPGASMVIVRGEGQRGTPLFRRIALARLGAPAGARVCIDVADVGLEIAQVALSFGVSDLGGLTSRRGLPVVGEGAKRRAVEAEIAGYIVRAKRTAVFVDKSPATPETRTS